MSTIVSAIPVVGLPTLTGWSQVVHSHIHQLVCALAVSGPGAHNIGRDLVDVLTQAEPFDSVTLHQLVLDLLTQTRKAEVQLQLIVILYANDKLILAACNGQVLYRKPTGETKLLLTADAQPQLIEGKLIPGATLIALTDQAAGHTDSLLTQLESGWEAERLVTNLLPTLHGQPDSSLCALACVVIQPAEADLSDQTEIKTNNAKVVQPPDLLQNTLRPLARSRKVLVNSDLNFLNLTGQKLLTLVRLTKEKILLLQNQPKIQQLISWPTWPKSRKTQVLTAIGIGLALLSLLIGIIFFQSRSRQQKLTAVLVEIKPAENLILEARQQISSDPVSARDQANQAITNLTALQQKYPKPAYLAKPITTALTEAKKFAEEISGLSQLKDLNVFFDLRLAEPNFVANSIIVTDGNQAYFIDQEMKKFVKLDISKKQSQSLALTGLTKLTATTFLNQQLYFLGDGLASLAPNSTDLNLKTIKPTGDSDREATLMASYGSYLYLLNPIKRNIFRFTISKPATKTASQTLSEPIGWLVNKKGLDFGNLTSLAVDGDIWLATKDGKILKYTQGQPVNWQVSGLKTAFSSNLILVTNNQLNQLYVLEPSKRRLVVLTKTGQFLKELQSPTLAAVTSFGVSETLQKAFFVSGSTVYELGL